MKILSITLLLVCFVLNYSYTQKIVEVIGVGTSEVQAKNDALRNAIEQGVGVKIFSETVVKNFVALKDILVSESLGLVTEYTVLSKQRKGQIWEVRIRATVSANASTDWAKMKVILEQKGYPSIMFCIKDKLDNQDIMPSIAENNLVRQFYSRGFSVIDRQTLKENQEIQKNLYQADLNYKAITALAAEKGADLVVIGEFNGTFYQSIFQYGMNTFIFQFNVNLKIVNADNAQIVAAISEDFKEGDAGTRESAGRSSLVKISKEKYTQILMVELIKSWMREVGGSTDSGTDITLTVLNIPPKQCGLLTKYLRDQKDQFTSVQMKNYRNNRLVIQLKSRINTEDLFVLLSEVPGIPLQMRDLQKNTLEMDYSIK